MTYQLPSQQEFSARVLDWYDANARALPWRSLPGQRPDPYHVWLSEIMLQQTTVVTVGPYFDKFLTLWPTVQHMAAAPLDDILTVWAGLGYYARARNLHKCAIDICDKFAGTFPNNREDLLTLPGIGPYTAAAISSIAFDRAEVVVDGNIERIIARLFRIDTALPAAKKPITEYAAHLTPCGRPGDYAQALMDIGATICTPRNPKCAQCPVSVTCTAFAEGDMERYPVKAPKKAKPTRRGVIFWIEAEGGVVLLRRREEKGLLGGMMEFPSSPWQEAAIAPDAALEQLRESAGLNINGPMIHKTLVRHTFTHFHLELQPVVLVMAQKANLSLPGSSWVRPEEFENYALPTLMKKVVTSVQSPQTDFL
ncbi:MAG: A/G-specific adenine glycosylase [Sneathiella sp.]|nr:MAG: A/G-specific adenine glycosylase [Sneathiella sp.]